MTETQFQDLLHKLYQGDPDTPDTNEDDYTLRQGLLQAAIRDWETEEGVNWFELWAMNSDEQSQSGNGSTVDFAAPTNFRFPGGFVRVIDANGGSAYYKVYKPDQVELHKNERTNICWFTGNESEGFTLHFLAAPASGTTIDYPYYKQATYPDAPAEILEMSNPMFAIRHVLSALYELDGEGDKAVLELQRAGAALKAMKTKNEEPAFFQDNEVLDEQMDSSGEGFGR